MKVFVSHKQSDSEFAKKLASDLRANGIYAWLDIWDMPPGEPITDVMSEGIENSDVMLLLLSKKSVDSITTKKGGISFEVNIAEGIRLKDTRFKIIGILLEDCEPPEKLGNRIGRWLDFKNKTLYKENMMELLSWLKGVPLGPHIDNLNNSGISEIRIAMKNDKIIIAIISLIILSIIQLLQYYHIINFYKYTISYLIFYSLWALPLLQKGLIIFYYGALLFMSSIAMYFLGFVSTPLIIIYHILFYPAIGILWSYDKNENILKILGGIVGALLFMIAQQTILDYPFLSYFGISTEVIVNLSLINYFVLWAFIIICNRLFVAYWNRFWKLKKVYNLLNYTLERS